MTQPIKRVAIVGGTHGNELTGVFLLEKWRHQPERIQRPSFESVTFAANPKAISQRVRYIDQDLNRCFTRSQLSDLSLSGYELERARSIDAYFGQNGSHPADLIIDLHTSTANMGKNIVLTQLDAFHQMLARYLYQRDNSYNITSEELLMSEHHFLCSIAPRQALVEIGPVAQGSGHDKTMHIMEQAVFEILDFIEQYNTNSLPDTQQKIPAYEYFKTLSLPTDKDGQIAGVVHQSLQDQDFKEILPGAPLFHCFDGTVINYESDEAQAVYASFINEAAYYDNALALSLLKKIFI